MDSADQANVNQGFLARLHNLASVTQRGTTSTIGWKDPPGTHFVVKLNLPFKTLMPGGNVYKIETIYGSDNWEYYLLSDNVEEAKKLRPVVTSAYLKIRTYSVQDTRSKLNLERQFWNVGFYLPYNSIHTDRFHMPAGSKSYKSVLINGGKLFLYGFCAVTTADAASGSVSQNPFEFLVKHINEDGTNTLLNIIAIQGQRELNKGYERRSDSGHAEGESYYTDWLRVLELAGVYNDTQKSYYHTTLTELANGYGCGVWSCASIHPDSSTSSPKLINGAVDWIFKFEKPTDRNLVARFVFIIPNTLHLYAKSQENGSYVPHTSIQHGY